MTIDLGTEIPIETSKCRLLSATLGRVEARPTTGVAASDWGYACLRHRRLLELLALRLFTSGVTSFRFKLSSSIPIASQANKKAACGIRGGFVE